LFRSIPLAVEPVLRDRIIAQIDVCAWRAVMLCKNEDCRHRRRIFIPAAAVMATNATAQPPRPVCFQNGDNENATLTGEIVASITTQTNDGTGERAGVKYFAIALDKPICF
jgi:hypothetical protein